MLVLSRKIGEQILIPELGISVTVLSVGTNPVQLGIKAPQEIQITRPEANSRPTATPPRTQRRGTPEKFRDRTLSANAF